MPSSNKRNLQFFEAFSMRELFDLADDWQRENEKRFLSLNVQRDGDRFCCIALTNPTEVMIVDGSSVEFGHGVQVWDRALSVSISP